MTAKRSIVIAALGALGVLLTVPLRAPTSSAASALQAYDARGVGSGIQVTFALRPNILDPLANPAVGLVRTTISSQGDGASYALAAQVFPLELLAGGGQVGGSDFPGLVRADYPPGSTKVTATRIPDQGDTPLVIDAARSQAEAREQQTHALASVQDVRLSPDPASPTIRIGSVKITSDGTTDGTVVTKVVQSQLSGISFAGGLLKIDSLVAVARAVSDGVNATADSTLAIGDVTVEAGGERRAATIDNSGVHISDPSLPPGVQGNLEQKLQTSLGQAGLTIFTASPTKLVEGPAARATSGGLQIALSTGRPPAAPLPAPPVPPPPIPSDCSQGICVGPGLLPIPPGDIVATLSLGSVSASATASGGFVPTVGEALPGSTGFGGTPEVSGGTGFPGGDLGGGATTGSSSTSTGGASTRRVAYIASVARMPAGALFGVGVTVLAAVVALLAVPILRRR
jgi:hypothetical protein